MTQLLQIADHTISLESPPEKEFVTLRLGGQLFGIAVTLISDVLRGLKVTRVPLAPAYIIGSLNLRGRIVTALDMHAYLELPPAEKYVPARAMSVVVEYKGECYSLRVDCVGEVLSVPIDKIDENPANLPARWRELANGVYKLPNALLVILDVRKVFILNDAL